MTAKLLGLQIIAQVAQILSLLFEALTNLRFTDEKAETKRKPPVSAGGGRGIKLYFWG